MRSYLGNPAAWTSFRFWTCSAPHKLRVADIFWRVLVFLFSLVTCILKRKDFHWQIPVLHNFPTGCAVTFSYSGHFSLLAAVYNWLARDPGWFSTLPFFFSNQWKFWSFVSVIGTITGKKSKNVMLQKNVLFAPEIEIFFKPLLIWAC